jgi:hypothetical protein
MTYTVLRGREHTTELILERCGNGGSDSSNYSMQYCVLMVSCSSSVLAHVLLPHSSNLHAAVHCCSVAQL